MNAGVKTALHDECVVPVDTSGQEAEAHAVSIPDETSKPKNVKW
jgi:hypothetical protein